MKILNGAFDNVLRLQVSTPFGLQNLPEDNTGNFNLNFVWFDGTNYPSTLYREVGNIYNNTFPSQ
jgi:hypothetical protein